jgi:hypothetical protein
LKGGITLIKLKNLLVSTALIISGFLTISSSEALAKRKSSGVPYVVFANGHMNCCAGAMDKVIEELTELGLVRGQDKDIIYVPYSSFKDGDQSGGTGNNFFGVDTNPDTQFTRQGVKFIEEELDKDRPLILIGHSFGGDSLLKLVRELRKKAIERREKPRKIFILAVFDSVTTWGYRETDPRVYSIGDNVEHFFNRFQKHFLWPKNYFKDGKLVCAAYECNQKEEIFMSREFEYFDNGVKKTEVVIQMVPCLPWRVVATGCRMEQERIGHQDVPLSINVQRELIDVIRRKLKMSLEESFQAASRFQAEARYCFDGSGKVCATAIPVLDDPKQCKPDSKQKCSEIIQLKAIAVDWRDIPIRDLGFPKTSEQRFIAMYSNVSKFDPFKYSTIFPNFEQGIVDGKEVYGAFLVKRNAVEIVQVSAQELGNPQNPEEAFRAADLYAQQQRGFIGGYPTNYNGSSSTKIRDGYYSVVMIGEHYGQRKQIPFLDLFSYKANK